MLILCIETSTEQGMVGICQDDQLLWQNPLPRGFNNSSFLVPFLAEGLNGLQLKIDDFGLIAVGIGPGSYTGMRVGAIAAKTLSYAKKIPLVGICSLATFTSSGQGPFAVLFDAKISGVYGLKGEQQGKGIIYAPEPFVSEIEALPNLLANCDFLLTPHGLLFQARVEKVIPEAKGKWQEIAPDMNHLAKLALDRYEKGFFSLDGQLELLYLRKTQAEIEKETKA